MSRMPQSAIRDAQSCGSRHGRPSFSLANRAYRALWSVTWGLLGAWTPPPLAPWRAFLLRVFGATVGRGCTIGRHVTVWSPANLVLGQHVGVGPQVNFYTMAPITVGDYAVISQGAHLCCGSHRIDDPQLQLTATPIVIGANAWLAAECFVGPGVVVGTGAVLGARGCTFSDLDDWTVYRGNPARAVKQRRPSVIAP